MFQSFVNYSFCEPEIDLKTEFLKYEKDLPVIESSKEVFVQFEHQVQKSQSIPLEVHGLIRSKQKQA